MNNRAQNILALSMIKGVGDAFVKTNLIKIETYIDDIDLLGNMLGGKVTVDGINENLPLAAKIIEDCAENDIKMIPIISEQYPLLLKEIKNPPTILYLKGNIIHLEKCVAIIGTRKSDDLGNRIASKIGKHFSINWSICNGLVEGIDKNAILKNESVYSNVTGVLSGGLNYHKTSSKITIDLADKVLHNNGLLISENPPNKREDQFSGSKASRIQAGLSKGIIIIQTSSTGGSKYTLKAFSELNRVLGVISYKGNKIFDTEELFSGNNLLLDKGIEGVAEMCEIKKMNSIKFKNIIPFNSKDDYILFEKLITD
jgi:DNA processing protein